MMKLEYTIGLRSEYMDEDDLPLLPGGVVYNDYGQVRGVAFYDSLEDARKAFQSARKRVSDNIKTIEIITHTPDGTIKEMQL